MKYGILIVDNMNTKSEKRPVQRSGINTDPWSLRYTSAETTLSERG